MTVLLIGALGVLAALGWMLWLLEVGASRRQRRGTTWRAEELRPGEGVTFRPRHGDDRPTTVAYRRPPASPIRANRETNGRYPPRRIL